LRLADDHRPKRPGKPWRGSEDRGDRMTKVLIIDDHEVVRAGLKSILGDNPSTLIGEAATAAEALELAQEDDWDVAVLDLSLGGRIALDLLKQLRDTRPRLPILVLTMHSEEQYARRAFKAGAAGFLTKDSSGVELSRAIHKVARGERYVSPAMAERLVGEYLRGNDRPRHETLSDRELEVLRLIASGKRVGEIAEMLTLSNRTVSTYRARLLAKMELRTNAELTHYAIQNGLVD
jgi:two-component system invasion response regulator UvrY